MDLSSMVYLMNKEVGKNKRNGIGVAEIFRIRKAHDACQRLHIELIAEANQFSVARTLCFAQKFQIAIDFSIL